MMRQPVCDPILNGLNRCVVVNDCAQRSKRDDSPIQRPERTVNGGGQRQQQRWLTSRQSGANWVERWEGVLSNTGDPAKIALKMARNEAGV